MPQKTTSPQCMTAWGKQKVRYSTHAPPKDNYILDRDEEQEENVVAAGRANLQQSE